jgi:hypothetical protein
VPIQGLTNREASFPEIGTLRKGAPKPETGNRPGADLKHFRFDCDDAEALALFNKKYGEKPTAINVFVPFKTVDENFEAWGEEYTASSLRHRCDGQTCVLWITDKGTYSKDPKPCPKGCKPTGRLKVIIPELQRLAYVTVTTTSKHDIMRIYSNLLALEQARGSLQGIPLVLRRTPEDISTPDKDGKRARREIWLISIEAQPQWVQLQLAAQEQAALPSAPGLLSPPKLALPAYAGDDDDDDDFEPQAATPQPAQTKANGTATQKTATPSGPEAELNSLLLRHCVAQKGNERAGKAYFDAVYAKQNFEAKQKAVLDLGLVATVAEEEIHQAEIVETETASV